MSVAITVQNALKKFEDGSVVIPDLSIKVRNGELFTLLGPSGCGKTTLLRMIAGFNSIEGGKIYFDDREINDVDPGKRNIGMVFQNYAIFPNMTVRKNVAFGLRTRKLPPDRIKKETRTRRPIRRSNARQIVGRTTAACRTCPCSCHTAGCSAYG